MLNAVIDVGKTIIFGFCCFSIDVIDTVANAGIAVNYWIIEKLNIDDLVKRN